MPQINFKTREIQCKIVYCGPALGGKTTNIKSIHQQLPASHKSELQIIDTADDRTLFFDFFSVDLAKIKGLKARFLCYAVPGQSYYRATRKMVLQGVDGVVFVADSDSERLKDNIDAFNDMKLLLQEHGYDYKSIPMVIQANKRDLPSILSIDDLNAAINDRNVKIVEAVAIESDGVIETFKSICNLVTAKLSAEVE